MAGDMKQFSREPEQCPHSIWNSHDHLWSECLIIPYRVTVKSSSDLGIVHPDKEIQVDKGPKWQARSTTINSYKKYIFFNHGPNDVKWYQISNLTDFRMTN